MIPELGQFSVILALCIALVLGTVPLVGAFFIDFINALVITGFVNWLR